MTGYNNRLETGRRLAWIPRRNQPQCRRRDIKSAVQPICEMAGFTPQGFRLEVPIIKETLRKIRPAAHGVSSKTWANIRSLFGGAPELAGVIDQLGRGIALRHPVWGPLVRAIASDKRLANGLAAFANSCAAQNIIPEDVSDAVLPEFHTWLENRTLCPKPRDLVRGVPKLWNEASGKFEFLAKDQAYARLL